MIKFSPIEYPEKNPVGLTTVTFRGRWCAPLHYFLFLAGCDADIVTGALATILCHEVEAMFEIGNTVR